MKLLVVLVGLATFTVGDDVPNPNYESTTAYGYLTKIGIPAAERIRKAEEELLNNPGRIVGGQAATLGQFPYQAGLLISIVGIEEGQAICGAVLISNTRLLTAAHCWFDGFNRAWKFEVVLGSVLLYRGGTRIHTSAVTTHRNWRPLMGRNDIAAIYLPSPVRVTANIAPIALPSDADANENFAGSQVTASGFGLTRDGGSVTVDQFLSHIRLQVITNGVCNIAFPLIIQPSHICTSGVGGIGICRGDSGGPLVLTRNNRPVLIGLSSFISGLGCESGLPAVYSRITYFLPFIRQHL